VLRVLRVLRVLPVLLLCPVLQHTRRYPYNLDFDFGALEGLNKFSINNLGDPFIESNYGVHSREFEVCVSQQQPAAGRRQQAAGWQLKQQAGRRWGHSQQQGGITCSGAGPPLLTGLCVCRRTHAGRRAQLVCAAVGD
jgi:hypothetical protein